MSISDDPDQIRRDIERTQANLSSDVDALTEKVTPSRIVERRVGRARAAAGRLRERVMGTDDPPPTHHRIGAGHAYSSHGDARYGQVQTAGNGVTDAASSAASSVSDATSTAASTVSDAASSAATAVQQAPQAARRQTQGNPLAAGLIAFGAGWLISSLLPASRQEQQLAEQTRDKATELGRPLAEKAKQAATEVSDNLQEPHGRRSSRSSPPPPMPDRPSPTRAARPRRKSRTPLGTPPAPSGRTLRTLHNPLTDRRTDLRFGPLQLAVGGHISPRSSPRLTRRMARDAVADAPTPRALRWAGAGCSRQLRARRPAAPRGRPTSDRSADRPRTPGHASASLTTGWPRSDRPQWTVRRAPCDTFHNRDLQAVLQVHGDLRVPREVLPCQRAGAEPEAVG